MVKKGCIGNWFPGMQLLVLNIQALRGLYSHDISRGWLLLQLIIWSHLCWAGFTAMQKSRVVGSGKLPPWYQKPWEVSERVVQESMRMKTKVQGRSQIVGDTRNEKHLLRKAVDNEWTPREKLWELHLPLISYSLTVQALWGSHLTTNCPGHWTWKYRFNVCPAGVSLSLVPFLSIPLHLPFRMECLPCAILFVMLNFLLYFYRGLRYEFALSRRGDLGLGC